MKRMMIKRALAMEAELKQMWMENEILHQEEAEK
jgi:hypothetical protein